MRVDETEVLPFEGLTADKKTAAKYPERRLLAVAEAGSARSR